VQRLVADGEGVAPERLRREAEQGGDLAHVLAVVLVAVEGLAAALVAQVLLAELRVREAGHQGEPIASPDRVLDGGPQLLLELGAVEERGPRPLVDAAQGELQVVRGQPQPVPLARSPVRAAPDGPEQALAAGRGLVVAAPERRRVVEPPVQAEPEVRVRAAGHAGGGVDDVVQPVGGHRLRLEVALRVAGDQVDHAADRVRAVQRGARAAHDLDALDVLHAVAREIDGAAHATGHAVAVDEHEGVLRVHPPQPELGPAERARELEPGALLEELSRVPGPALLDLLAANRLGGDGRAPGGRLDTAPGHDHVQVVCLLLEQRVELGLERGIGAR